MKKLLGMTLARVFLVAIMVLGFAAEAAGQVFVYPRRPHKSQVRYFEFDWRHIDILVGPEAGPESRDLGPRSPYDHLRFVPGLDDGSMPQGERSGAATPVAPLRQGRWAELGGGPVSPGWRRDGGAPALFTESTKEGAPLIPEPEEEFFDGVEEEQPGLIREVQLRETEAQDVSPPHTTPGTIDPTPPPLTDLEDQVDPMVLPPHTGGVRLFFYEQSREIAEKAAAAISEQYLFLVDKFEYVPTRTFPYILYSSYQEFLQTNLFPLQEGVLGVTSPRDLKLSLPYFGDHRLFYDVGLHELVHQFTIQKVRTFAENAGVWGDPLEAMPLWFIEGIAEFYAKGGVDHETEMMVRDIVVNPDFVAGYLMLDFHEDRPWSALWTYKVGQARAAFLEETYGEGIIQRIIEQSPLLVGRVGEEAQARGFPALLERLTGDSPALMSRRFDDWIKRRSFETYLESEQAGPDLEPLEQIRGRANALAASPDGNLLAYRSLDYETGRTRIYLVDRRDRRSLKTLAGDAVPGFESLHPVQARNFDLGDERVVFIAQAGGRDLVYVQAVERRARQLETAPGEVTDVRPQLPGDTTPRVEPGDPVAASLEEEVPGLEPGEAWDVRISLGRRTAYDVAEYGIIAAFSPTFEPEGERVAFIGLDGDGIKNVYVLHPRGRRGEHVLTKLTDDDFGQRQLTWGPGGIVFNSDGTDHGRYNLFSVDPDSGVITRLTSEDRDHFDPRALPDGRILFSAFREGRADLHQVVEGEIIRLTDIETGLFDVAPGPDGGVWALYHKSGTRRPALLTEDRLTTFESRDQPEPGSTRVLPRMQLLDDQEYRALSPSNWELGNLFGYFGAGAGGLFGQIMATGSDRLRDHVMVLNLFVFGSLELTDGYLLYINQQRRLTWGAGPFQSLRFRRDQTFDNLPRNFRSGERFFGGMFSLRYPFNRFTYVQGDVSIGGVSYFLSADAEDFLRNPQENLTGHNLLTEWEARQGGVRFQTEASARVGYDTIRYHPGTGPLAGSSAMLEGTVAVQPFDDEVFGNLRLDAERYFPIWGRTHFFLRGGMGTSFGGRLTRQFFLSSWDTIRGVQYGDDEWLLGRHFFFSTAELQFPLNAIIRLVLFTDLEGVLAVDFGGVSDEIDRILDRRVLNLVTGVNFGFGPLIFRLHFARPMDTGSPAGLPNGDGSWVTNFSLGWLYF